jgi:hypothetical protein
MEEIFPADDEAALAEVISDDFVNHEAPQRWTIHRALAEGDTVIRVVGGKGVEHWAVRDDAALMRQLTA